MMAQIRVIKIRSPRVILKVGVYDPFFGTLMRVKLRDSTFGVITSSGL